MQVCGRGSIQSSDKPHQLPQYGLALCCLPVEALFFPGNPSPPQCSLDPSCSWSTCLASAAEDGVGLARGLTHPHKKPDDFWSHRSHVTAWHLCVRCWTFMGLSFFSCRTNTLFYLPCWLLWGLSEICVGTSRVSPSLWVVASEWWLSHPFYASKSLKGNFLCVLHTFFFLILLKCLRWCLVQAGI